MKVKVYLQYVRLNNGGYDTDGRYFGTTDAVGERLYRHSPDGEIWHYFRAKDREDAKKQILFGSPLLSVALPSNK